MTRGNDYLDVFTVAEAALRLNVTRKTIYDAIRASRLKAFSASKASGKIQETVIVVADLDEFAKTLRPNRLRVPRETE